MAAACPYGALPLNEWRELLVRGTILSACAPRLAELHDLSFRYGSIASAVKDLRKAAIAAQAATDDAAAVAVAVARWREIVGEELANPGGLATDERQLLAWVYGLCLAASSADPFRAIFDKLAGCAAKVYGKQWPLSGLELEFLPSHPRQIHDPYALAGSVASGSPDVVVQIHTASFGPASFAALPALLVHELVCHVPARQGGKSKNDSVFAEGFMDWVAMFVFLEPWLRKACPTLALAAKPHGHAYAQLFANSETREGRARLMGRRAAENVVERLVETGLSPTTAEFAVARFALELNCAEANLRRKDEIVVGLGWATTLDAVVLDVLNRRRPAADLL